MPTYTEFYKKTTLEKRKSQGQYMTPDSLAQNLIDVIPIKNGDRILEPAIGTGQLIVPLLKKYPDYQFYIEGWDSDSLVLKYLEPTVKDKTVIKNVSSLDYWNEIETNSFDVVLANPPFFEFKPPIDIRDKFSNVISGRTNIFSLFFKLSIDLVKENGYVGFIVPPSMNNGNFFSALRSYISDHCSVEYIKTYPSNLFQEAQTPIQIIILKKTKDKKNHHIIQKNGISLFVENINEFNSYWNNAQSLSELGYKVKTGTTVWNQHKDKFESIKTPQNAPLIYSKDLKVTPPYNNNLYTDRRFLPLNSQPNPVSSPFVAVNRIVGGNEKKIISKLYKEDPIGMYHIENHVNFILPQNGTQISLEDINFALNRVSGDYLKLLTGNTQISKTELENLIPLKINQ